MKSVIIVILTIFMTAHFAAGQSLSSRGVKYTISPVISGTSWNNDLGLNDDLLYGGKLGIDFGRSIGLDISYLTSGNTWTNFSELDIFDTLGLPITDQHVKIRRYGGDLLIRWPSDRIAPFARAGVGIIRFEPESGDVAEKIDYRIGGGLDYILNSRMRARSWVEMNRFRLDRYSLAPGGATSGRYPLDPEADKIRNNISLGLSIDYALGHGRFQAIDGGEPLQPFAAVELEPMIGRLNFDDKAITTSTIIGARVGGELNPWVGWGFYYWHAMESDLSDTRPLQSYGGEARLSLGSKSGPQPFVTIGVGQLDFLSNFRDNAGMTRDDKTALIAGAGIRAEVIGGILLNLGVRDYMFSQGRLDRISGTNELSHNWMISGAVIFGIGGRGGPEKPRAIMPLPQIEGQVLPNDTVLFRTIAQPVPVETGAVPSTQSPSSTTKSYVSDKSIVIPVPLEGEVYIRYGTPSQEAARIPGSGRVEKSVESADTSVQPVQPVSIDSTGAKAGQTSSVSRTELDSLLNSLKSDIAAMLVSKAATPIQQSVPDTAVVSHQDSLMADLRAELAQVQEDRRRLDSLLQAKSTVPDSSADSLANEKMQKAIADQVAATLATRNDASERPITQSELNAMMQALTARMDTSMAQRESLDSARLRDQLQLEVIRQTKNEQEFQKAMDDFMQRYGKQQDRAATPPAIIVTQPAAPSQIIDRGEPTTVVIKPDTQFVFVRDTTSIRPTDSLGMKNQKNGQPVATKDFIDLRPSGYIGFGVEYPKQFILGGRLDTGLITAKEKRLKLVPEFALGLGGGGVSIMAVINAEYQITEIETGSYRLLPYARLGFGVLGFGGDITERDTEGVLNLTYGLSIDPRKNGLLRDVGNPAIFLEHQIIDLFDLNRVILGLQWSR